LRPRLRRLRRRRRGRARHHRGPRREALPRAPVLRSDPPAPLRAPAPEPAVSAPSATGLDAEAAAVTEAVAAFRADLDRLLAGIGRRLVGQGEVAAGVVSALLAGGHVLVEGVPGLGKTLLVRTAAAAMDLTFSRVQFTPDLMPADVLGTNLIVEDAGSRR